MIPQELVWCNDCHQYLDSSQFAKRAKSKNGFQPRCYSCFSRRSKDWQSSKKKEKLFASGQLMLKLET